MDVFKKFASLLLTGALIFTGCSDGEAFAETSSLSEPEESSQVESMEEVSAEKDEYFGIGEDNFFKVTDAAWDMLSDGKFTISKEPFMLEISDVKAEGKELEVKVSLFGTCSLNLETMEDYSLTYETEVPTNPVIDMVDGHPYEGIPVGEATIEGELGEEFEVSSFSCKEYENPGLSFLKAKTESLKDELDKSQKVKDKYPDMDRFMQRAIWVQVLKTRYVESFDDVTLYDLAELYDFNFNWEAAAYDFDDSDELKKYVADAEVMREMKKLKVANISLDLKDYSVFKDMKLDSLNINLTGYDFDNDHPSDISTLEIGSTSGLTISDFDRDFPLDLSKSKVEQLYLDSWGYGVTEFKGCDSVKYLGLRNTTTDMSLVNAKNFPNAETVAIDVHSEKARIRDLNLLSSFPEDVYISVRLSYQAANNETLSTLDGVNLDYLELAPYAGEYPLEVDYELLDRIDINKDSIYIEGPQGSVG